MTRIVPTGIDRRTLLKSSAAAGAALATGIAMPAIAQTRPIKLGYVSPQTGPLAAFAEADNFIIANFKETQINKFYEGMPVEFTLDAFPGVHLNGKIISLSDATGARFSLLPPDNASGNFVDTYQNGNSTLDAWVVLPLTSSGEPQAQSVFVRAWKRSQARQGASTDSGRSTSVGGRRVEVRAVELFAAGLLSRFATVRAARGAGDSSNRHGSRRGVDDAVEHGAGGLA